MSIKSFDQSYSTYSWVKFSDDNISYGGYNYNHSWGQTVKPSITPQAPVLSVLANGVDGSISVSQNIPVNVTINLNPGGFTNTQADWWVFAYLNGYLYYYHFDNSSGTWQWTTQASPTFQGVVSGLSPYNVFSGTIPAGMSITFYFAVDLTMNGVFDSPYYYDYVTVTGY